MEIYNFSLERIIGEKQGKIMLKTENLVNAESFSIWSEHNGMESEVIF